MYTKLSHNTQREFIITENNLLNKLKREIIRGVSTNKPIFDLLISEEVRAFLRAMQRVNQSSFIDDIKQQVLSGIKT